MCGIAGIVGEGAGRYGDRLVPMLDAIAHRGPDGDGVWQSPQCLLGHRRLSIIDLAGGAQPMRDEETGTVLTFNGEVYGYRELRAQCHGYPFRTSSDTEVILALYRRHGADFVRHLPGMFAFALWDPGSGCFCALAIALVRSRFTTRLLVPAWLCSAPRSRRSPQRIFAR